MLVEYSSNNSGGDWWLKDEHWLALEKAGWLVAWGGRYFCSDHGFPTRFNERPRNKPLCGKGKDCKGHRRYDSAEEVGDDRFLGALAKYATKEFPSIADAIADWERVVGMDASDEGCNCCGAPHSFSSGSEYASGDEIVRLLHPSAPKTLREAAKALSGVQRQSES